MPEVFSPAAAEEFDQFEQAGWRGLGRQYHDDLGPLTSRAASAVLAAAGAGPGQRLLDLGTGPGYLAGLAAAQDLAVVAGDVSEAMLTQARMLYPDPSIDFELIDARQLPYADNSFDVVTAGFLLLHTAVPDLMVREAARVLRPGGRFAASVYDEPGRARFAGIFGQALAGVQLAPPAMPAGPGLFDVSSPERLERLFADAGLRSVRVERLELTQPVASAQAFYDSFANSTVRAAALLAGQSPAVAGQIVAALADHLAPYRSDTGYAVPVSFLIASGHRPATEEQP